MHAWSVLALRSVRTEARARTGLASRLFGARFALSVQPRESLSAPGGDRPPSRPCEQIAKRSGASSCEIYSNGHFWSAGTDAATPTGGAGWAREMLGTSLRRRVLRVR